MQLTILKCLKIAILLVFIPLQYCHATYLYSKQLSVTEGLSNDFVCCMTADSNGFVWVGTKSGLNRITSYGIQKYTNANSLLCNNNIITLCYENTHNEMWVGTSNGISIINIHSGHIRTLSSKEGLAQNSVTDIKPTHDGGLWILSMSNGVQYYDVAARKLHKQNKVLKKALGHTAHCCMDDGKGHLYIGYNNSGMSILDIKTNKVRTYRHHSNDSQSLPSDNVRCIVSDSHGNIWVGTNNGLAMFDQTRGTFSRIENAGGCHIGDNIYDIKSTQNGRLLVASNLEGASVIETSRVVHDGNVAQLNGKKLHDNGYAPCIRAILGDKFDNVWVGSYGNGVCFYNARPIPFNTLPQPDGATAYTYGVAPCSKGGLWVGSDSEIFLYRSNQIAGRWSFRNILHRSSAFAYVLHEDRNGNLWIGFDDEGVVVFNTMAHTFKRIELSSHTIDIFAFKELSDGCMLIGSELGLYIYHNGKATYLKRMSSLLPSSTVYSIATDRRRRLWVGTDGGGISIMTTRGRLVARLNDTNGLAGNTVPQILQAKDGSMLIATNGGLCRIPDIDNINKIEVYGSRSGLSDLNVKSIAQDRNGHIWVSTYTNIAKLDNATKTFAVFGFSAGIPAGGFAEGSVALTLDGNIYFGSPKGVCCINTMLLRRQPKVSPIDIVGCETVAPDMRHMTTLLPDEDGTYRMKHNASSIRIAFSVANYGERGMVDYAYMMDGLDDKWYYTNGQRDITFRNLAPGKYTFKVKACLLGSQFTDDRMATIKIVVSPPWWATWWMILVYAALTVATIVVVARSYKRKLVLENSLKIRSASLKMERMSRQKEKELNESRIQFYTNMAHELRTPMTLVVGPVDDLRTQTDIPQPYRSKLDRIYQNAMRLLDLINRLMEFRKTETGNMTLTVSHGDICHVVRSAAMRFVESCSNKGQKLITDIPDTKMTMLFDHNVINHILDNLLSNAQKYTPQGGSIRLSLTSTDNMVNIIVADTGYGISKEALPHIFEQYYQESGNRQASGTGIGLALVKSLVTLHEGSIDVESKQGRGTTFTLHLSRNSTYPNALHKEQDTQEEHTSAISIPTLAGDYGKDDSKPLLIVVEDNDDIRNYIATELIDEYRIKTASNGLIAMNMALDDIPDIVISDVMMPEMDGIELCRRLKNDIRTSHVPIVLLTAKCTMDDKEEGYRYGADSYLTKPFSIKLLRTRLANLMDMRQRIAHSIADADINTKFFNTDSIANDSNDETQQATDNLTPLDRQFVNKFNGLVAENIDNSELEMAFFTDKLNMSYSSFYRKVKALYDMTPVEFLRKMRLKHSVQLLGNGDMSVKEAAQRSGFDNLGHFRKCFKDEFGMSPSEFRCNRHDTHAEFIRCRVDFE